MLPTSLLRTAFVLLSPIIGMHSASAWLPTRFFLYSQSRSTHHFKSSVKILQRPSGSSSRLFHPPAILIHRAMSSQNNDDPSSLTVQLAAELVNGQSSHARPIRACIAIAGGGSHSASTIASTPGASSLLLESVVTYDRRSFADYISQNINVSDDKNNNGWLSELEDRSSSHTHTSGSSSDSGSSSSTDSFHFCSAQAAILLSRSALRRSLQLSPSFRDKCLNCVGLGSASSLVGLPSSNPDDNERRRKRKSRAYIACSSLRDGTMVWEVELDHGLDDGTGDVSRRRTRAEEEAVVSNLILASMLESRERIGNSAATKDTSSLVNQILTSQGDTFHQNIFGSNDNDSETPVQSPANGARRIIDGDANLVVVLPVNDKMESLFADEQVPLPPDVLIVPGSFNPPHIGHVQLANAAVAALKRKRSSETIGGSSSHPSQSFHSIPSSVSSSSSILNNVWSTVQSTSNEQYDPTVLFEISVTNVDKPPIDPEEVETRLNRFLKLDRSDLPKDWGVVLTNAPLFSQKASVLENLIEDSNGTKNGTRKMTFVIGTDTMIRIINPKYYGNSVENMIAALEDMKGTGVHFIVGGRLEQGVNEIPRFINGKEEHESLPMHLQQMFTLLEEKDFRVDISSTELRKNMEAAT